jgi:hypothetical protein
MVRSGSPVRAFSDRTSSTRSAFTSRLLFHSNVGWGGSWTKERYESLKGKHPEALMAFEAELRQEKDEEQHRRETLEKYSYSPYIEEVEGWPDSEAKDCYLKDLKRLRDVMLHLRKLRYGGFAMGMIYGKLKNKYPEAHQAFNEELSA